MDKHFLTAGLLCLAMAVAPIAATGAELKVLAGGSMTASLKDLGPKFEAATGHKLDITFAATPELIKMSTSAPFDLGVVPVDVMKNDDARAKFAGTPANIARVGYGVAVKAGAPKPDVGTLEALKGTLLKAQSIAVFPTSAAGAFVQKTFERLGIMEVIKDKLKVQAGPAAIRRRSPKARPSLACFSPTCCSCPASNWPVPSPATCNRTLSLSAPSAPTAKMRTQQRHFSIISRTRMASACSRPKA